MNTPRSEQLYKTACGFMPGGVNSPVRACKAVGTVPLFIDKDMGRGRKRVYRLCMLMGAEHSRSLL